MSQSEPETVVESGQPFSVRLSGRVLRGFDVAEVQAALATLFKRPVEEIATFFPGKPCLLKSGIDQSLAQRYADALREVGAEVHVDADQAEPPDPAHGEPADPGCHELSAAGEHQAGSGTVQGLSAEAVSDTLDHWDLGATSEATVAADATEMLPQPGSSPSGEDAPTPLEEQAAPSPNEPPAPGHAGYEATSTPVPDEAAEQTSVSAVDTDAYRRGDDSQSGAEPQLSPADEASDEDPAAGSDQEPDDETLDAIEILEQPSVFQVADNAQRPSRHETKGAASAQEPVSGAAAQTDLSLEPLPGSDEQTGGGTGAESGPSTGEGIAKEEAPLEVPPQENASEQREQPLSLELTPGATTADDTLQPPAPGAVGEPLQSQSAQNPPASDEPDPGAQGPAAAASAELEFDPEPTMELSLEELAEQPTSESPTSAADSQPTEQTSAQMAEARRDEPPQPPADEVPAAPEDASASAEPATPAQLSLEQLPEAPAGAESDTIDESPDTEQVTALAASTGTDQAGVQEPAPTDQGQGGAPPLAAQAPRTETAQGKPGISTPVESDSSDSGADAAAPAQPAADDQEPVVSVGDQTKPVTETPDLIGAFSGDINKVKVSTGYKIGLGAVGVAMVLLPLAYVYLIGWVAYGVFYHATVNVSLFFGDISRFGAVFLYFIPLVVGFVLLIFMFKPILAPWSRRGDLVSLDPQRHPRIFAFVGRVCETVGAPRPAQINVDCEVNASARFRHGWRSFFTNELVVTIGLPLLAGMNTRQVAGILAHEFGHFTQGAGMRMTYIIRMINRWLYHGAYERDLLDEKVTQWSRSSHTWVYVAFQISRLFIWAIRQLMKGFMRIGLVISAIMSRQMEFDADRYEARVSGSDQFKDTNMQLRRLHIAAHNVYNELQEAWHQHQMLVDDLSAAIAANYRRQPPEVEKEIEKYIADSEGHLLDSHPTDRDRIANADQEAAPGVYHLSVPATHLIAKFEKLSKEVTFLYYRNQLEIPVTKAQLLPLPVFEAKTQARQQNETALEAYFGDSYNPFIPFECQVDYNSGGREYNALLSEWRKAVQAQRQRYLQAREHQDAFNKANKRARALFEARALINCGVRINARDYALTNSHPETIARALNKAVEERQRWFASSKAYVELVQRRMQMVYAIINHPENTRHHYQLQQELMGLVPVAQTLPRLNRVLQEVLGLNDRTPQLSMLLRHSKDADGESDVIKAIKRLASECDRQLQGMMRQLKGVPYPFEHTNPNLQLHEYVFQSYRNNMNPAAIYHCCEDAIATLTSLQLRCVGQLANMALDIETRLGLIRTDQKNSA